jgi:indoleamine 2,3-dioxygenase
MSPYILPKNKQLTSRLKLDDFDITENGFLPSEQPLQRLPNPYYHRWEEVALNLPQLIRLHQIRGEILQLPILSTKKLHTEAEWRRAYVLLAFMTHGYIWGGDIPAEVSDLCFKTSHTLLTAVTDPSSFTR